MLDPDQHGGKQLYLDPQNKNADPQPCIANGVCIVIMWSGWVPSQHSIFKECYILVFCLFFHFCYFFKAN